MTKRFTVDSDGKYWDKIENKYVTIDHLFRLVESLEKENEQLKQDATKLIYSNADYRKENEQLKQQLLENNCDNCKHSKAIYVDVECRKKGFIEWRMNCADFKGDVE